MCQCPSQSLVCHVNVSVLLYVLCSSVVAYFPLLKRLKLSAAGENIVHLLQHYQRSKAALLAKSLLCVTQPSCLPHGFLPVNEILHIYFAHLL